ncbi:MAG: ABC transporter permease [Oceanospirillales bacterium LUC14_002_19_P2]|nr:MAG: ABC transporter permease [Oceanospirillales bacterium LUC14_002_19_P2]
MDLFLELFRATLPAAVPILLAALGGLYTHHANVFNIAMEGMMLIGAFCAVAGSYVTGSWMGGLLFGMTGGLLAASVTAFFAVKMKTDEFVTGIAMNLLAAGGTTYLLRQLFHVKGAFVSPRIEGLPVWNIPLVQDIPVIGDIVSGHPFLLYVTFIVVFLVHFHLFHTRFGLRLRAAGEESRAVDAVGISSDRLKIQSLLLSGALCGLAGVFLSLGYVRLFAEDMSNGRGWISLAVIILTRGRPIGILAMSLLFGFTDGLGFALQDSMITSEFTQMVPYIVTLLALYWYSREKQKRNGKQVNTRQQAGMDKEAVAV